MRRARHLHCLQPLLVVAALLGVCHLADLHNTARDVSRDARSSLAPASVAVLAQLPQPVTALAFVPEAPALRRGLADFFARYRRHKPDFSLRFIDPRSELDSARSYGARLGDVILETDGRRERIRRLDESETTNALARLARGATRFVTFLAGNGERRTARDANHDLSRFAEFLSGRGLALREYVPGRMAGIPDNTAVLVLASPAVAYGALEQAEINAYVAAGGNLLWLTEPDAEAALVPLERAVGFARFPGTIVDPLGLTRLRNPAYAVALAAEAHPSLDGFNQTVAMPHAAALVAEPNVGWTAEVLASTEPTAWTETGPFEGNVGFDAADEVEGALALALALTRPRPQRPAGAGEPGVAAATEQRVIVIGDGDFLSNTYVDNLGNREFGRRVFEWLAADDRLIALNVEPLPDGMLDLALWQRLTLLLFFAIGLPLAFAVNGGLRWWRRRHA